MLGHVVSRMYTKLLPLRTWLFAACLTFVLVCSFLLSNIHIQEDIRAMLPSSPPLLEEQFVLLSSAPFIQYTTLTIGKAGTDPLPYLKQVEAALQAQGFTILKGPDPLRFSPKVLAKALDYLPSLLPVTVYEKNLPALLKEQANETLQRNAASLHSLSGIVWRDVVAKDPFSMYRLLQETFKSSNPLFGTQMREGYIISADENYGLLMVTQAASITDSGGAAQVMRSIQSATAGLPEGVTVLVTGGQRHTYENATVIKNDLTRIVPLSLVLITVLFFLFLRSTKSLLLLLLPVSALIVASAFVGLYFDTLSGIVLGFGGVLLGITTDYSVHVYYAVGQRPHEPGKDLAKLATPLCLAAFTTIISFSMLVVSNIPVIQQLAIFSIIGLMFALLFALFVLPHLFTNQGTLQQGELLHIEQAHTQLSNASPSRLLVVWLMLIASGVYLTMNNSISGDIKKFGYQSQSIQNDEAQSRAIWGRMRDGSLIVVTAPTMEQALQKNDEVYQLLREYPAVGTISSLAPFLPSLQMQQRRHEAWQNFWNHQAAPTRKTLESSCTQIGFSKKAFDPFYELISSQPSVISMETLHSFGIDILPTLLMASSDQKAVVYTILAETEYLPFALQKSLQQIGAHVVSSEHFREQLAEFSRNDIMKFSWLVLGALAVFTGVFLRSLPATALALLPVGTGLIAILAIFKILQTPMNLFHILALPLVMGLSVDYGIFMVFRNNHVKNTRKAVLLSALTTISTFGCLALAQHPALFSLGSTIFGGMTVSLLTALLVIPLIEKEHRSTSGLIY